MTLILPLHPKWAGLIQTGVKTIEVRKTFSPKCSLPTPVFLYTTTPRKAITGRATLTHITDETPSQMAALERQTCVPADHLTAYLGSRTGRAAHLSNPQMLDTPIPLDTLRERYGFTAPQSFCYAKDAMEADLLKAPTHSMRVMPLQGADLPIIHPLINLIRLSYPNAHDWFGKVADENRPCYGLYKNGEWVGMAIMAIRSPTHRKLCSFISSEPGTGSLFLNALLEQERQLGTKTLHGDALNKNEGVLRFFKRNGFTLSPHATKANSTFLHKTL